MASQYFVTYRLKPSDSFEEFGDLEITFEKGYKLLLKRDLAWISFEAGSEDWENKRDEGFSLLETCLSAVALIKEYPFGVEQIQWIEAGREGTEAKYILGRLAPIEPVAQAKPPNVTAEDFHRARQFVILAEMNPFFKRAIIDYSVALGFLQEGVIFLARVLELMESHFRVSYQGQRAGKKMLKARDVMRNALCLPDKELNTFHRIANETILARHARNLSQLRAPAVEELKFCVVFCRTALDRFASYLLYENRDMLRQEVSFPNDFNLAQEFIKNNADLQQLLRSILSGELK